MAHMRLAAVALAVAGASAASHRQALRSSHGGPPAGTFDRDFDAEWSWRAALDTEFEAVESSRAEFEAVESSRPKGDEDMEPHMSEKERTLLYDLLKHATYYQEFGAGGSTVVALKFPNIRKIHTVESAASWVESLSKRKDVSAAVSSGKMKLVHANVGKTQKWGVPIGNSELWPVYAGEAAQSSVPFDLIFVDGRFRVACLLRALQRLPASRRSSVTFAMHDYVNRPFYHAVEQFVDVVRTVDTLAVFKAKADIDTLALQAEIAKYERIWQ